MRSQAANHNNTKDYKVVKETKLQMFVVTDICNFANASFVSQFQPYIFQYVYVDQTKCNVLIRDTNSGRVSKTADCKRDI